MAFGRGGPIVGHAIIKALGRDQEATALAHDAAAGRAPLDEEELREVEYASMGLPLPVHAEVPPPRRSFLRRLFRR